MELDSGFIFGSALTLLKTPIDLDRDPLHDYFSHLPYHVFSKVTNNIKSLRFMCAQYCPSEIQPDEIIKRLIDNRKTKHRSVFEHMLDGDASAIPHVIAAVIGINQSVLLVTDGFRTAQVICPQLPNILGTGDFVRLIGGSIEGQSIKLANSNCLRRVVCQSVTNSILKCESGEISSFQTIKRIISLLGVRYCLPPALPLRKCSEGMAPVLMVSLIRKMSTCWIVKVSDVNEENVAVGSKSSFIVNDSMIESFQEFAVEERLKIERCEMKQKWLVQDQMGSFAWIFANEELSHGSYRVFRGSVTINRPVNDEISIFVNRAASLMEAESFRIKEAAPSPEMCCDLEISSFTESREGDFNFEVRGGSIVRVLIDFKGNVWNARTLLNRLRSCLGRGHKNIRNIRYIHKSFYRGDVTEVLIQ